MKRSLKALAASPWGWRALGLLRPPGVVVLMYHRIVPAGGPFEGLAPGAFRAQMLWLQQHCTPLEPEDYLHALYEPAGPRTRVLVTFDDALRDYHDYAYPVLSEIGITALVFAPTAFVGTDRMIWTDAVSWAFQRTPSRDIVAPWEPSRRWTLGSVAERRAACASAKHYLKGIPTSERLGAEGRLYEALGVDPGEGSAGRQVMTWDEVRATLEYTRYGGHSHTHPILSQITAGEVETEVRLCRDIIERETGLRPTAFAYPNGRRQDFTETVKDCLRNHGFELGFSTVRGINGPTTDRYAIRRQPTTAATVADFAWLVGGYGTYDE